MKHIVYTRPDGGVSIFIPAPKAHLEQMFGPMTEKQYRDHVYQRAIPENAINVRENVAIPQDRAFRAAWRHDLSVDMDKARLIHMTRIRAARDEKLKKLDIETMKGIDVQAEKQVLRDLPATFDLSKADTPDALKALWPKELSNR